MSQNDTQKLSKIVCLRQETNMKLEILRTNVCVYQIHFTARLIESVHEHRTGGFPTEKPACLTYSFEIKNRSDVVGLTLRKGKQEQEHIFHHTAEAASLPIDL